MRKDYFYICTRGIENRIVAEKRTGYSEGDIGLHKSKSSNGEDIWIATHIPTGLRLMSLESEKINKNRQRALKEAKKILGENSGSIEKHMKTEQYEAFRKSRYEQTVTKVF